MNVVLEPGCVWCHLLTNNLRRNTAVMLNKCEHLLLHSHDLQVICLFPQLPSKLCVESHVMSWPLAQFHYLYQTNFIIENKLNIQNPQAACWMASCQRSRVPRCMYTMMACSMTKTLSPSAALETARRRSRSARQDASGECVNSSLEDFKPNVH